MTQKMPCRGRGFTLIELMVVITVLAILAAVAIPNYTAYVTRSKRAGAKTVLLDAAAQLERNYSTNGCYNKNTTAACATPATAGNDVVIQSRAPAEGRQAYVVTASFADGAGVITGQVFTLTATPCGTAGNCPAGSETSFTDAECGNFVLAHTGNRTVSGTGGAATCWQR